MEERPAVQEPSLFFFRGAGGGLACPDFFRMAGQPEGRSRFCFRGWQPSWELSYRESLIGRAPPACCRPVWGLSGFFFALREKTIRTELSQARASGRDGCPDLFFAGLPNFRTACPGIWPAKTNPGAVKTNLDRPGSLGPAYPTYPGRRCPIRRSNFRIAMQ